MTRSTLRRAVVVLALALLGAGSAPLRVEDAWIAQAPPNASVNAGYMAITNLGQSPVTLTGASAEGFGSVMIHRSEVTGGVARMHHVMKLEIPAGAGIEFAPGGYHLMLMDPAEPITEGMSIPVTLRFERAGDVELRFEVRRN